MQRRHDIDALRALAFGLVILYHVAMYYVAGWDWHLKSPQPQAWLQAPMRAINLWRMDLVFLVSGLALGFLVRGRTSLQVLAGRSLRLLLPLAFGMAVVVPFQPYAETLGKGLIEPGFGAFLLRYYGGGPWPAGAFPGSDIGFTWNHLWFLPYLWLYTVGWLALRPLLASGPGRRVQAAFTGLRGMALALPVLPLLAWSLLLWPHFPPTRDVIGDGWLHAVYFTLFLYGTWIGTDAGFWAELRRLRWPLLGAALGLLSLYLALRAGGVDRMVLRLAADAYLWAALLAILGWAHHGLNRPWPWLGWANDSVYPWYVLHQTLIVALVFWLAPFALPPGLEAAAIVAGTLAGCWGITAVVRGSRWLRPLFGLPRERRRPQAASAASMSVRSDAGASVGA